MSVDTYLLLSLPDPKAVERLLAENPELNGETTQVGKDFVALYEGHPFAEVSGEPERWGPEFARALPPWVRRLLRRRGVLAVPEVGQSLRERTLAELEGDGVWLPIEKARTNPWERRVLLVPLSPGRTKLLLEDPDLVREIVDTRKRDPIPGALELDSGWISLHRLLFDAQVARNALAPSEGLCVYEDRVVEAARVLPAVQVAQAAEGLAALLPSLEVGLTTVTRAAPSADSQLSLDSLGSGEATGPTRPPRELSRSEQVRELARVSEFYAQASQAGHAVLSVRFRTKARAGHP